MRITVKNTCCCFCAGELVIDNGKITCIDNCELQQDGWNTETMAKIQQVIDYQKGLQTDRERSTDSDGDRQ